MSVRNTKEMPRKNSTNPGSSSKKIEIEILDTPKKESMPPNEISWSFEETNRNKRPVSWYILAILLISGTLYYSIIKHEYLFMALIIMFVFTFILLEKYQNRRWDVNLNTETILINQKVYNLTGFSGFEIKESDQENYSLLLKGKKFPQMTMSIPISNADKQKIPHIKNILLKALKEEDIKDSMDSLISKLKF